jgi:hypothetical protein
LVTTHQHDSAGLIDTEQMLVAACKSQDGGCAAWRKEVQPEWLREVLNVSAGLNRGVAKRVYKRPQMPMAIWGCEMNPGGRSIGQLAKLLGWVIGSKESGAEEHEVHNHKPDKQYR